MLAPVKSLRFGFRSRPCAETLPMTGSRFQAKAGSKLQTGKPPSHTGVDSVPLRSESAVDGNPGF